MSEKFDKLVARRDWTTIRTAYNYPPSKPDITAIGTAGAVNLSNILTYIIQVVGRFAERFASDVLFQLDDIQTLVNECTELKPGTTIDKIITIGVRRNGVDHDNFIMHRIANTQPNFNLSPFVYPEYVYRAILACRVVITQKDGTPAPYVECTLRSIMDNITKIDDHDLKNGRLVDDEPEEPPKTTTIKGPAPKAVKLSLGDHVSIHTTTGGAYNHRTGIICRVLNSNMKPLDELMPGDKDTAPYWYRIQFDTPVRNGDSRIDEEIFLPRELTIIKP